MRVKTSTGLHGAPSLETGNWIGRHTVLVRDLAVQQPVPIRISPGQVEKVDAGEYDKEPTKERQRIDSIRGVEATEEYKAGAEGSSGERDII